MCRVGKQLIVAEKKGRYTIPWNVGFEELYYEFLRRFKGCKAGIMHLKSLASCKYVGGAFLAYLDAMKRLAKKADMPETALIMFVLNGLLLGGNIYSACEGLDSSPGGHEYTPSAGLTINNPESTEIYEMKKVVTCWHCGKKGHFKRDRFKLKNNRNQKIKEIHSEAVEKSNKNNFVYYTSLAISTGNGLKVPVSLKGRLHKGLIVTGADVSIIDKSLFAINDKIFKEKFVVTEGTKTLIILGQSFCQKEEIKISFGEETRVEIGNKQINADILGKHRIITTSLAPVTSPMYRLGNELEKEASKIIEQHKRDGIIRDSQSAWRLKIIETPVYEERVGIFLGMINYCCRFLQGVSLETKYLYGLIKKNANTDFGTLCRDEKYISAIESLKNLVSNAQTLSLPRDDGIFILTTDASDLGVGAILSQVQEKEEKIISYFSKVHNKAEENYGITEKELLAVIKAVQQFRSYLLGRKFILRTDHSAIKYLFTTRNMKGRLARWSLFDFLSRNYTKPLVINTICSKEVEEIKEFHKKIDGYRYLVTVIDHWSKRAYVGAVRSKSATEVTTCLLEAIRKLGVPKTILSDNGKEFSNSEMLGAAKELGIEWKFGAPYSPTATGLVERFNLTYTNKLKKISEHTMKAIIEKTISSTQHVNNYRDTYARIKSADFCVGDSVWFGDRKSFKHKLSPDYNLSGVITNIILGVVTIALDAPDTSPISDRRKIGALSSQPPKVCKMDRMIGIGYPRVFFDEV
ncbi:hypothetical protein P3W45_000664 [Vairimorpha bombi]